MAIDIWGVWAEKQGTADIATVPYDESEFADDIIEANEAGSDMMVLVQEDALRKLREKWSKDDEKVKVIDKWLEQMEEHGGQPFVRLVVNY
jgi:hypothetical protein